MRSIDLSTRRGRVVVCLFISMMAVIMGHSSVQRTVAGFEQRDYVPTQGTLTKLEVRQHPRARATAAEEAQWSRSRYSHDASRVRVHAEYEFDVNGTRRTGTSIGRFHEQYMHKDSAAPIISAFGSESPIVVMYDPGDPERSYLDLGEKDQLKLRQSRLFAALTVLVALGGLVGVVHTLLCKHFSFDGG